MHVRWTVDGYKHTHLHVNVPRRCRFQFVQCVHACRQGGVAAHATVRVVHFVQRGLCHPCCFHGGETRPGSVSHHVLHDVLVFQLKRVVVVRQRLFFVQDVLPDLNISNIEKKRES